MAYKLYQNFGSVLFRDAAPGNQANEVEFPKAIGQVLQEPVYRYSYETNTGKLVESLLGYRVTVNATISATNTADSAKIYDLMVMLNELNNVGGNRLPIYIYPRYDVAEPVNDWYECFCTSPIAPQDGSNAGIFQIFNLSFRSKELVNRISTTINLTNNTGTITDGGSDYNLLITSSSSDYNLILTTGGQ